MSNSLDLDQARHFVGPDLGPNCLQRLSADDTRRQKVNHYTTSAPLLCDQYPNPNELAHPYILTLNGPIETKVVCFSRLLKCLRSLYGKQCGPRSDCCSGSTLFVSILNSSVMLSKYLQQTTSADDIFRCIFSWRFDG